MLNSREGAPIELSPDAESAERFSYESNLAAVEAQAKNLKTKEKEGWWGALWRRVKGALIPTVATLSLLVAGCRGETSSSEPGTSPESRPVAMGSTGAPERVSAVDQEQLKQQLREFFTVYESRGRLVAAIGESVYYLTPASLGDIQKTYDEYYGLIRTMDESHRVESRTGFRVMLEEIITKQGEPAEQVFEAEVATTEHLKDWLGGRSVVTRPDGSAIVHDGGISYLNLSTEAMVRLEALGRSYDERLAKAANPAARLKIKQGRRAMLIYRAHELGQSLDFSELPPELQDEAAAIGQIRGEMEPSDSQP